MVWKSAPHGKIVPLMPSPRSSPPRIGIIRLTPWPKSPATIGTPILMARLKTYWSEAQVPWIIPTYSFQGEGKLVSHHALRQPGRQQRKCDQNDQPNEVGRHERKHAPENSGKRHVLDHAFDDEDIHSDRRMDQSELHRHHDDHAEPD